MTLTDTQIKAVSDHAQAILDICATSTTPPVPPLVPPVSVGTLQIAHVAADDGTIRLYITPPGLGEKDFVTRKKGDKFEVAVGGVGGTAPAAPIENTLNSAGEWAGFNYPAFDLPSIDYPTTEDGPITLIVEAVDGLVGYMPLLPGVDCYNGHSNPPPAALNVLASCEITVQTKDRTLSGQGAIFEKWEAPIVFTDVPADPRTNAVDPLACQRMDATMPTGIWHIDFYRCLSRPERRAWTERCLLNIILPNDISNEGYSTAAIHNDDVFDISGGKVLHIIERGPRHWTGRRWNDVFVIPADDIIVQNAWIEQRLNPTTSKRCLFFSTLCNYYQAGQFDPRSPDPGTMNPNNGKLEHERLCGTTPAPGFGNVPIEAYRCTPGASGTGDAGHKSYDNGVDSEHGHYQIQHVYISREKGQIWREDALTGQMHKRLEFVWPMPLDYTLLKLVWCYHNYHLGLESQETHGTAGHYTEEEIKYRDCTPDRTEIQIADMGAEIVPAFPTIGV